VEVLHPGIDLTTFRPGDGHSRSGEGRVLFVGGRWEDKGGPDLLAALGDDLGRGVELDVVTPAAIPSRPGLTVRSAGPGSPEVLGLFRRADVLCLPTYVDAVPWVVIEAMACGVPVVATDVGSIPELVGDAGRIVAPGDRTGLRAALLGLLADADLRAALGAAGRAAAEERFDARRNTGRLLSLLADVAASAGARAGRTRSGRPA
jgi:glycosyltransferase involved in cell wall biosynthesis